jgi:diguanylate cyclase (GGDEF)-like protein
MSIASKINLLIAAVAIVAGILLTVFVGERDYKYQRDALVLQASSLVSSRPQLQLTLYYRDADEVEKLLAELLSMSPAVKHAILYDNQGNVIGRRSRPSAAEERLPRFSSLRDKAPPLEPALHSVGESGSSGSRSLLSRIGLAERSSYLTLPITSVVNPLEPDLERADFAAALAYPELVRSIYVSGFVALGISSSALWKLTLPTVLMSATAALAIVLLFALLARATTRRITAPLGLLARAADDIAAGKQTEPLRIRGSGEVQDIANVLNGIISGLHQYTTQMDTDRKILSMKVDERTQQLSRRSEELDQAVARASEAQDKVRQMAYFDTLTSLPNRRLFTEQLTLLLRLAARNKENVGLLLVDIDNFKRINDSLGARAGDDLLREIGRRLTDAVRDSDVLHRRSIDEGDVMDLSRMGGDEFTVVLNRVDGHEAAELVSRRLAERIAEPIRIGQQEVVVSASIGIALFPDHADTVEKLLQAANSAMSAAKKRGRNRIITYDTSMEASTRDRLQLETDLRRAVERGQLLLHYQPQVHSRSGEIVGAECLVRWNHPDQGLVPPFKWIPMAEELGLIEDVGNWVLQEACRSLVTLRREGYTLPKLAVNVSSLQFNQDFLGTVKAALAESGLPPESIELELTEGIMINDQESTVALVQALKDTGVRLSIDDFGTGYSSLSYLSRFPLDELKIDRSFVLGLARGERNAELVRAIIAMGRNLGMDIVVEGVEHPEELKFFREEEAEVIQGFLFSEPVPLEKLRRLLVPDYFAAQLQALENTLQDTGMQLEQA